MITMINEVGEIQNRGYILALKCDHVGDRLTVAAVSDNILKCSWTKIKTLQEILNSEIIPAFDSQVVAAVTSLLLKYRSLEESKYKMTLSSNSRYEIMCSNLIFIDSGQLLFSVIECSTPNVYLFEIEEIQFSVTTNCGHSPRQCQVRLSRNIINRINHSTSAEELTGVFCDAALEIISECDVVWTVKFMSDSSGMFINGKHRPPIPTFNLVGKLPPDMVNKFQYYLNKNRWRVLYDLNENYSAVHSRDIELLDLSMTKFITITNSCRNFLRGFGVRNGLAVVIVVNGSLWGMFMLSSIGKLMVPTHEQYALLESISSTSALKLASLLRGDIFAHLAHEFCNPLHDVVTSLQLLQTDVSGQSSLSDNDSSELIESALQSCHSMLESLNETLNFNKGSIWMDRIRPVHLHDFLLTVIRKVRPFSNQKSILLSCCEGPIILPSKTHQTTVSGKDLIVLGEETRITQMLRNLLGNAIKFTPENGSVVVRFSYMPFSRTETYWNSVRSTYLHSNVASSTESQVIVDPTISSDWVVLEVLDTGIGIPEASMQVVFESSNTAKLTQVIDFDQVDELGLDLVRYHVRAMGGVLCVASTQGVGTLFFCAFPAQHCSSSDEGAGPLYTVDYTKPNQSQQKTSVEMNIDPVSSDVDSTLKYLGYGTNEKLSSSTSSVGITEVTSVPISVSVDILQNQTAHRNMRSFPSLYSPAIFLVVDDSPLNLRLLQKKIELAFDSETEMAVECISAANGSIAVETYKSLIMEEKHNLLAGIFMDYHMPVCNGADAIAQIRAIEQSIPALRSVHIIGFTADISEKSNRSLLESGADEVLPKPTPTGHVESTCRNLVQILMGGLASGTF